MSPVSLTLPGVVVSLQKTSWTISIYAAVPVKMLANAFRFHACRPMTTAAAMSSGRPCGAVWMLVSLRQYITSMPMIAGGRTLPR